MLLGETVSIKVNAVFHYLRKTKSKFYLWASQ